MRAAHFPGSRVWDSEELFVLTLLLCSLVPLWKGLAFNVCIPQRKGGGGGAGCIGRGGGGTPAPVPGLPAYAQPLSPWQQVPGSMVFVTDSIRPQPLCRPSNRLSSRFWGCLGGPFPSNASLGGGGGAAGHTAPLTDLGTCTSCCPFPTSGPGPRAAALITAGKGQGGGGHCATVPDGDGRVATAAPPHGPPRESSSEVPAAAGIAILFPRLVRLVCPS